MVSLYHQLGHRSNWSIDSVRQEHTADGVVIGPRYMARAKVEALPCALRRKSFFDPQFYLPAAPRGALASYKFFPDVLADGFATSEYDSGTAQRCAELCIAFQSANEFRYCVIPTRYREGTPTDFIDSQMELFVQPFLSRCPSHQPVLLQLIMNDAMLKDEDFRSSILNWVTGLSGIRGVYLIPHLARRPLKQVDDIDYLLALLGFIWALRCNNMEVIVGYVNTESVPLLVADPSGLTMGSYENLRMFGLTAFEPKGPDAVNPRRGPNPRVYVPRLLQWIEQQYLGAISQVTGTSEPYVEANDYQALMFDPYYDWNFHKVEPYKHYFVAFSHQFRELSTLEGQIRYRAIVNLLGSAMHEYEVLGAQGVRFDADSGDSHLAKWLTAINLFAKQVGWFDGSL